MFRSRLWLMPVILSMCVFAVSCGWSSYESRPSVAEAKDAGWQREVEPCKNSELFPGRFENAAIEELGGGDCAYYWEEKLIVWDLFNVDFLRSLITTTLGAILAITIAYGSYRLKTRNETRQEAKASDEKQSALILVVVNEIVQNQETVKSLKKFLRLAPPTIAASDMYNDVWKSVQAEMVSRGLPLEDALPTISGVHMMYGAVGRKSDVLQALALDSRLGRLRVDDEFFKSQTDELITLIDASNAEGIRALESLGAYYEKLTGAPITP